MISILRPPPPVILEHRLHANVRRAGPVLLAMVLIGWPSVVGRLDPVMAGTASLVTPAPAPFSLATRPVPRALTKRVSRLANAMYPPEGVYWVEIGGRVREVRAGVRDQTMVGRNLEARVSAISSEPIRFEVSVRPGPGAPRIQGACERAGDPEGPGPIVGAQYRFSSGLNPARVHPVSGVREPHWGVDIAADDGAPISPVLGGVVSSAGPAGNYGNRVVIDHGSGLQSLYAHMRDIRVRRGDTVSTTDTIGRVGRTGNATGSHLHLELSRNDRPMDPCDLPVE